MGQNQTKSGTHQKQPKHVRKALNNNGFCYMRSPCFGYNPQNEPAVDESNLTWKQHILEQLRMVDGEEWPQLLITYLEENNTEAQDVVFQSDIFWADFNAAKKPVHYTTKPIGLSGSARKSGSINESTYQPEDNLLHSNHQFAQDDQVIDQNPLMKSQHKKDITGDIKKMIAASDILEEKVFGTNDNEAWMQRSFNIKPNEDIKSRAASIEHFRYSLGARLADPLHPLGGRFSHQPFEESKQFPIRESLKSLDNDQPVTISRNSVVAVERYENNTFIQQPPVDKDQTRIKSRDSSRLNISREEAQESGTASMASVTEEEKLYRTVVNYKTLTGIIDKHVRQQTNVFCQMFEVFEAFFMKAYGNVNDQVKSGNMLLSEVKGYIQQATRDLQQFIRLMFEGINLFYKLDKLKVGRKMSQGTLFNRNNMLNFITSIIFNKKIHDTIFKLYQIESLPIEDTYEKSLKRCQNLSPQEFGIPHEFCLNEKTMQYFKEKNLLPPLNRFDSPPNHIPEYLEESELTSSQESRGLQDSINHPEIKLTNLLPPPKSQINGVGILQPQDNKSYKKAIDMLKNLQHRRSPIHKLKTIVKVAENITLSIEDFYREAGVPNTKRLDADQILAVFMYILAKSGLTDVTTHCKIIENFTTNNVLDSVSGYYATTLEACVNCICSISLESGVTNEDGISPTSGDFNQYSSMPSWVGGNKKYNDVGSMS